MNCDLVPVRLHFRKHSVAITADIENASLQVAVWECDRDALRFFWFERTPELDQPLPEIVEWRMTRVPFGTTASLFLLAAILEHHLTTCDGPEEQVAKHINKPFYVDDLLTGAATLEEARLIVDGATAVMKMAGLEMRKWTSNSPELQTYVNRKLESIAESSMNILFTEVTKLLGIF